jgi:Rrf2 family transcriptional regulator, iron-sulfur cluster assembly transcription factor
MLSKTSKQAINALVELAKLPKEECEGAASVAKRIKAPQNYLGKLLQNLSTRGLVVSQKGLGGGFRLAKDPKRITLYDIVEPMENVSQWSNCALGLKNCSDQQPCAVHDQWKKVKDMYIKFLRETNLTDLIK